MQDLKARHTPGYAVGGLAGGEGKEYFCRSISAVMCCPLLLVLMTRLQDCVASQYAHYCPWCMLANSPPQCLSQACVLLQTSDTSLALINNTTLCETAFLYICMLNLSSQMRSDHRECRQQRLRKGWHAIVSIQLLPCRAVAQCTAPVTGLPEDKPRYVMGIGYPLDIVVCSALGADMFDSVYPTRTARFGVALVPEGVLKLKNAQYEEDFRCLLRPTSCSCDLAPPSSLASEFGLHLCNLAYYPLSQSWVCPSKTGR